MDVQGFAPITELVELLGTLDPPVHASMDPAEVNTPGGWIALDEVRPANLRGQLELRCSLYLIGPDLDPQRALGLLAPLLKRVTTVLEPDGPVVPQGVVLPGDPTPLPALRVPVYLYTD